MEGAVSEEFFLRAFRSLQTKPGLQQVWSAASNQGGIADALAAFGKALELDLTEASEWFHESINPLDLQDTLAEDLTYKQFTRRLGNFLLTKAYDCLSGSVVDLSVYIQQAWGQALLSPASPRHSSVQPSVAQSWISLLLQSHTRLLQAKFAEQGSEMTWQDCKHLIRSVTNICQLSVPERALKDYYALADQRHTHPVKFADFVQSIELWASQHTELQEVFRNMLSVTAAEYAQLQVTDSLQPLLDDLNYKLQTFAHTVRSTTKKDLVAAARHGIQEVFEFYAKAKPLFGPKPTFDAIESNNSTWDISKFMKFFADFGLLENSPWVSKMMLTSIFKKTAGNGIAMTVNQFIEALDCVATCYYSAEYDKTFQTTNASKTIIQKREMLYAVLELHQPSVYLKKLKGFGLAFSKGKTEPRINASDPSRSYVFRISPQRKRELEEWRESKSPKVSKQLTPMPRVIERSSPVSPVKKLQQNPSKLLPAGRLSVQAVEPGNLLTSKPISLKDLSRMKYTGKGLDFLEADDQTDWYVEKLHKFNKQQDLSYVLRMQDLKVSRGLQALYRNTHQQLRRNNEY